MRIREKVMEGLGFSVKLKLITFGLQTVTNLALARFLSSTDYGVLALALVYVNFLALFGDFGTTSAAIQREDLSEIALHTAFTIKAFLGVFLCLIGVGLALALTATGGRQVGGVLAILSTNFLINTLGFLPQTILTRIPDYRKLAFVQLASTLTGTIVTVLLLANRFSYWGVALGYMGSSVASVIAFNLLRPSKPRLHVDIKTGMSFLKFGGTVFLVGLLAFAILNADNFLIGWLSGPGALGSYAISFTWSFVVTGQITGILVSVLFPLYSRIQHDRREVKTLYLKSLECTAILVVLINVGLYCMSSQFYFLVLGGGSEKWFPALNTFRILCIDGLLAGLLVPIAPVTVAIGKPGIQLRAVALAAVVELTLLVPALMLANIEGVAIVVTIACMSQFLVYVPVLRTEFGIEWKELGKTVGPSLAGGAAMLVFSWALLPGGVEGNTWTVLIVGSLFLTLCFVLIHGVFTKWDLYREIAAVAREALR